LFLIFAFCASVLYTLWQKNNKNNLETACDNAGATAELAATRKAAKYVELEARHFPTNRRGKSWPSEQLCPQISG